jgi:hypothetical protein
VVILVRHRLSTQAVAELTFVWAQLRALCLVPSMDRMLVLFEASDEFRTGDVYRALRSSSCIVPDLGLNWENFAPPKVFVFFLILQLKKTRTCAQLFHLGCVSSSDCPFCPGYQEDVRPFWTGLPNSYQICSHHPAIRSSSPSSRQFGSPEFVWCSTATQLTLC